jgi:hypothetical protein
VSITSPANSLTLTPSPLTGTGTIDINLANANIFSALQTFTNGIGIGSNASTNQITLVNGNEFLFSTTFGVGATFSKAELGSTGVFAFTAFPTPTTAADTGISRDSAGVIDFGNGTAKDKSATLQLKLTTMTPQLFSALATCVSGLEGTEAAVTDSTTVTFNATITGSGTNHIHAYCNGTNWVVQ